MFIVVGVDVYYDDVIATTGGCVDADGVDVYCVTACCCNRGCWVLWCLCCC